MAEIYSDTLSAGADTGSLTVTVGKSIGIGVQRKAAVEAKRGAGWNQIFKARPGQSFVVIAPSSALRITDLSGAANEVQVEDDS